jgi:protein-tyrosine phosphatase
MTRSRILFVCTGNICRSPTAEAVARGLAEKQGVDHLFQFDSAGMEDYHVGDPPDPRSAQAAAKRGYDMTGLRARRVTDFDFITFDHILAMDRGHLKLLERACPSVRRQKLGLFLNYSERFEEDEVPDPYYGNGQGFEHVLDLIEDAATQLILKLSRK